LRFQGSPSDFPGSVAKPVSASGSKNSKVV
jgi:hypothetical protein